MKKPMISFTGLLALVFIGKLFISSAPDNGRAAYQNLFDNRYKVFALNLPEEVYFCGERVPLEKEDVKERFDREIHVNTYWQSNIILLVKRSNRYFPIIEPILKRNGIPEDFKYLPLIESGFQDMVSSAGAEGPWQFLANTARSYGLEVNEEVDERYHLAKVTQAACEYLNDSYKQLKSWSLVAAAYNAGNAAIKNVMEKQGINNYYDLNLNDQTARYVPRLIAIKEIMSNPGAYGLQYKKYHLYGRAAMTEDKVDSALPSLPEYARSKGINFKILKIYNPWLKGYKLTNKDRKAYTLVLPKVKNPATLELEVPEEDPAVPLPQDAKKLGYGPAKQNAGDALAVNGEAAELYAVLPGEDLKFVAQKLGVHTVELLRWNDLSEARLNTGQLLKYYRSSP